MALGQTLRAARLERGLGLREVARELGLSPSSLSEFEQGKLRLKGDRILDLSRLLGVVVDLNQPVIEPRYGDWRVFPDNVPIDPVTQAALDLFVERGYHGTSVRRIAEASGLSVSGIYTRTASKQDLLVTLVQQAMRELTARCEAALADARSPQERLANIVECLVLFHIHRVQWAYLATFEARALEGAARGEHRASRSHARDLVQSAVADCRAHNGAAAGARPEAVTSHEVARAIVTMCVAIPQWYVEFGGPNPDQLAAQYVALATAMTDAQ